MNKKELKNILNKLDNGVDKFIVAGLFYGLNKEEISNLKINMVDLENSKILLPSGREVIMDEILKEVTTQAINQKIYVKMGSFSYKSELDYEFNCNSEYVVKTKPNKTTAFGLNPLSDAGFKTRIRAISNYATGNPSTLTTNALKKWGAFEALKELNKKLTIVEAEAILKKLGLSIRRNNLIPVLKEINAGK